MGAVRGEGPPPEKSFGFFDLPTRGRLDSKYFLPHPLNSRLQFLFPFPEVVETAWPISSVASGSGVRWRRSEDCVSSYRARVSAHAHPRGEDVRSSRLQGSLARSLSAPNPEPARRDRISGRLEAKRKCLSSSATPADFGLPALALERTARRRSSQSPRGLVCLVHSTKKKRCRLPPPRGKVEKLRAKRRSFSGGGRCGTRPPPEKCFAFFDLPTRGRSDQSNH